MSIKSEIIKKQDFKEYINKIIDELMNGEGVYEGNIKEEKLNGIYETISFQFKKVEERN